MKKEKQVRSYQRKTKSGKVITVKAHTATYDAAEEAMQAAKKPGAGEELEAKKKGMGLSDMLSQDLQQIEEERKRPIGSGTNGPERKTSFTSAEFKEWYRGTGSAADKKVEKALRKQLGKAGYKKLEDEAIDKYSSRGHLSMFKRLNGGADKASLMNDAVNKVAKQISSGKYIKEGHGKILSEFADKVESAGYALGKHDISRVIERGKEKANSELNRLRTSPDADGVSVKHNEDLLLKKFGKELNSDKKNGAKKAPSKSSTMKTVDDAIDSAKNKYERDISGLHADSIIAEISSDKRKSLNPKSVLNYLNKRVSEHEKSERKSNPDFEGNYYTLDEVKKALGTKGKTSEAKKPYRMSKAMKNTALGSLAYRVLHGENTEKNRKLADALASILKPY